MSGGWIGRGVSQQEARASLPWGREWWKGEIEVSWASELARLLKNREFRFGGVSL